MAKKKKQKIDTKALQAQNKNKYMRQMKVVYDRIHPDLFPTLRPEDKDMLYSLRGSLIRIKSEQRVSHSFLDFCDAFIKMHMKELTMIAIPDKLNMTLLEYCIYFIPLDLWAEQNPEVFEGKEWFTEEIINGKKARTDQYDASMHAISISLMRHVSNQQYGMCHIEYKVSEGFRTNGDRFVDQKFVLKYYIPEKAWMTFSDRRKKTRTALEVVHSNHRALEDEGYVPLAPLTMLPSQLGVKTEKEEKPLPVFILRHALRRLDERLGCVTVGFAEAQIVPSLLKGNVCYTPDGSLLVEYYIQRKKAGYFVVELDQHVILIRTFLFLTNVSTPEGQNLRKYVGLQKDDIKFLNIDRLTPLMESDILQDEEICEIFRKAGCESLLELCETLKGNEFWKLPEEKKQLAEKLKKYMQLNNNEEEELEDVS